MLVYAVLFGALSSLLAVAYVTLYNQGIKFFEQLSLFVLDINIWSLVLLTVAGLLIGLASIRPNWPTQPPLLASILLQAFIALWSGAAIDPEGPVVFLSGGVGSFIADRLKLIKKT